jgi:hypothetical protein
MNKKLCLKQSGTVRTVFVVVICLVLVWLTLFGFLYLRDKGKANKTATAVVTTPHQRAYSLGNLNIRTAALSSGDGVVKEVFRNDKHLHDNIGDLAQKVFADTCGKKLLPGQEGLAKVILTISKDKQFALVQVTVGHCGQSPDTKVPPATPGISM